MSREYSEMPLTRALYVLVHAHTRDDEVVGFTVHPSPDFLYAGSYEYAKAWGVVRRAIGEKFDPPETNEERSKP